ncbi:MAG: tetratricopeptide repeat protein [Myxococcota bacterium]
MENLRPVALAAAVGVLALAAVGCAHSSVNVDPEVIPRTTQEAIDDFGRVAADYSKAAKDGEWDDATCDEFATRFEKVYKKHGAMMAVALFNAGAVRERCGDPVAARAIYERAVEAAPKLDEAHNQLGVLALRRGDDTAALRHFTAAIQASPTASAPRNNLAAALRGRYAAEPQDSAFRKAENQIQNVLAVDSDNRLAFENLARLYYDRGRLKDKAYLLLADLVVSQGLAVSERLKRDSPDLYVIRGLILMEHEADVRALRAFEEAVTLDPEHGDAHMNIAMIALRFRDFDSAKKSLDVARQHPNHEGNIETYLGLGVAHRGLRDYKQAQKAFERAQELDAADPRPQYNLGVLFQEHIAPAADEFDEGLNRKAIAYFNAFSDKAGADDRYVRDVKDARFRVGVIKESIQTWIDFADLKAKADEIERKAKLAEEKERRELLELERRAQEAAAKAAASD